MPFVTVAEALQASRSVYGSKIALSHRIQAAITATRSTRFDIYLSHAYEDQEVITGVATLLEAEGYRVYLDWRDDPQLDRTHVTSRTAELLQHRMRYSRMLLYATTRNSSGSRWMPWELGYFDGHHQGKVGILPIVSRAGGSFVGEEYLGLYPTYERFRLPRGWGFGRRLSGGGLEMVSRVIGHGVQGGR